MSKNAPWEKEPGVVPKSTLEVQIIEARQPHLCILKGQFWVHKATHIVPAPLGTQTTVL